MLPNGQEACLQCQNYMLYLLKISHINSTMLFIAKEDFYLCKRGLNKYFLSKLLAENSLSRKWGGGEEKKKKKKMGITF